MTVAVDYFAGAGGFSTGAAAAGVRVAAAYNHWKRAVETHAANHPTTQHVCQDIGLLNPAALPDHDLLLAAPSCQGFTRARGTDKPRHDACRATAWCVIDAAEVRRQPVIIVENVVDMRKWPLYPMWRGSLEALGYALTENILDASDFGVPQERVRLIVVAVHGERSAPTITPPRRLFAKLPTARSIIDLGDGEWSPVAGHCDKTMERIANGRRDYGRQFAISYYGSTRGGRSLDRPIGTITTLDRWAIVDGDRMRMLSIAERKRAMGFPADYLLTGNQREQGIQLGNAICPPMATSVIQQVLGMSVERRAA